MRASTRCCRWFLGALLCAGAAMAGGSGGPYRISRDVIAAGGARVAGSSFVLTGTVGQGAAKAPVVTSSYSLQSGFHVPRVVRPDNLFANSFETP